MAPCARSRRSVWSREAAGCSSDVGPSACRAASRTADLTWALATGDCRRAPCNRAGAKAMGARVPSARAWIRAPIARNGSTTRPIGRRRSESSPVTNEWKGRPARTPLARRSVVPLLPHHNTSAGSRRPENPRPRTTSSSPCTACATPSAVTTPAVACVSAPSPGRRTRESPDPIAPSSRARWVMDLSPGTRSSPRRRRAGWMTRVRAEDISSPRREPAPGGPAPAPLA